MNIPGSWCKYPGGCTALNPCRDGNCFRARMEADGWVKCGDCYRPKTQIEEEERAERVIAAMKDEQALMAGPSRRA